ncbi:MAG: O-antigen ligase family protein [Chloroflexota bacterium]|nr:O-antigen ligase family protein [Chloroflexota bacterium]
MNFKNLININNKIIEIVYLFAILSIPVAFSPEELFGFYQFPKEFLLHSLSNILLICLGLKFLIEPNNLLNRINSNRLAIAPIALILFSYFLSSIFSVNQTASFFGREYGMSANSFQTYFALSVIFIGIFIRYEDIKNLTRIFISIIISTSIISIIGLLQFFAPNIFETFTFYHQDRIVSTLGNPIYFGSVLLIGIQLTIVYFLNFYNFEDKKGKRFIFPILILSIQYAALLLTLSRGPQISFIIGITIIFISYFVFFSKKIKKAFLIFAVPILISILIVSLPTIDDDNEFFDEFVERSGSLSKELELSIEIQSGTEIISPNTFNYRGENWIGAFKLISSWPNILDNSNSDIKRFFIGYGPDMYVFVYPITVPIQERIVISANAHNLFLNIFIENGFIGFSSIIFLIFVYLKISKPYLFTNSNDRFYIISLLAILFSRLVEQQVGLAVISDLLFAYIVLALIAIKTIKIKQHKINILESNYKLILPIFTLFLVSFSVFFISENYSKLLSSINLGAGIASLNEGEIDKGVKSLEKASRYNNRSEVIETELFKLSYKIYQVENKRDSEAAAALLPLMYERLYSFEDRSPYSFNSQLFITTITWEMAKRNPDLFREEAIGRYIRLRNLMPQYLGPQEVLANVLVAVGELELGKEEAEVGIRMSDYAGLNSPQSWWVKGEAERYLNEKENAIGSFSNSIRESEISTGLDYNSEHRDFAFLVLSNQSLGLLYENDDNQKAIYHIQEAIKIAYNTGNVLLLEPRFR